jgi:putative flavoprotein involved in K+ transport
MSKANQHYPVMIVGGGQAGLCVSYYLQQRDIAHLVLEKKTLMHTWSEQRWDSFCLVTPNWQCDLPGHPYSGEDPDGFMVKDQIIEYLRDFTQKVAAPALEQTSVQRVTRVGRHFRVETSAGIFTADQIVVATGAYQIPIIPQYAARLPAEIDQVHVGDYKNPAQLPEGDVLVVGSGQSGAQIAEDLHLAGRKVYLAVGNAPRCARFYRGKDVVRWLAEMGYYEISVMEHPLREGVRDNTNHYVTGRDGGRDIDLRKFALEGMELFGPLQDFDGEDFIFQPKLAEMLDNADAVYNNINSRIDQYIESHGISAPPPSLYQPVWQPPVERGRLSLADSNITSVVWCVGLKPDYGWLQLPVFDSRGYPAHQRGVTDEPGVYFIGLPWLHTWGSGRFSGVARDAEYLVNRIAEINRTLWPEPLASPGT